MKWNEHSTLVGKHAKFSPSQPSWLKYDGSGMKERYYKSFAQQIGTADAISFQKNNLIIFDLKTGETLAHMEQLLIYAALFCLEYGYRAKDLNNIELRIYQLGEAIIFEPELSDIVPVIDHIKTTQKLFDKEAGDLFGL